jgi:putative endonuclease
MPREKRYYVYILGEHQPRPLVGVTGFLVVRILQHKSGETDGFTRRYRVHRLVYYETFRYVNNTIAREKEMKKWRREKKVTLIERQDPTWEDLAADWGKPAVMRKEIQPLKCCHSDAERSGGGGICCSRRNRRRTGRGLLKTDD